MKKTLTVKEYLDRRSSDRYNKSIRILDKDTKKNCGNWLDNADRIVYNVKVTSKVLFIFIQGVNIMRFYCVEINYNFNSVTLAYMFRDMGLTVIQRDCCRAVLG